MKPELLCPVGSDEALYAAVRSGADAVYMGYGRFNARRSARNFADDEFKKAVEYCHIRGVKVYLTLNTLVAEGEIDDVIKTVKLACEAGVDAIIVQDLGLIKLLKHLCPDMPLHASTQMTVTSPSALYELKELGFERVVLAREMNRREITELCDLAHKMGMETELFVHGALCMCVSGQCYMSAVIGRRSGNRGYCAQPCRLPSRDGKYPLSLKDLSLIDYLTELQNTGVDSLKIEGRMKRPEYIAAATAAFRQVLDNGFCDDELLSRLMDVFSRSGHTDGYFVGKRGAEMFGHRTETDLAASDSAISGLKQLYRNERQSVAVDVAFFARIGHQTKMTMTDGKNTVTVLGEMPQIAENKAVCSEDIKNRCAKLGGTPYYCNNFECEIDDNIAIPVSEINRMKRECTELIDKLRMPSAVPFYEADLTEKTAHKNEKTELVARFSDIEKVPDDVSGLDMIFVPADTPAKRVSELILRADGVKVGVELPRAFFSLESAAKKWLDELKAVGVEWVMCHNIAALPIVKAAGLKIFGGFGLNIFNSYAIEKIEEMGAERVTLSFETTLPKGKTPLKKAGIIAYGRLPLMLTRNCPAPNKKGGCASCDGAREIIDRAGERFPIECRYGMSEVLNSKVLWLADKKGDFGEYAFWILNFTGETRDRVGEVIAEYAVSTKPEKDFTRGLYERGVL